jgi:DNA-directed RNA polymerase subunit RPC12/RpoP
MGKQINMGQQQQVAISPEDLTDVTCSECGHQVFTQVYLFKKISAILSPTGQESMIPLPTYKCDNCGHIDKVFLPKDPSDG